MNDSHTEWISSRGPAKAAAAAMGGSTDQAVLSSYVRWWRRQPCRMPKKPVGQRHSNLRGAGGGLHDLGRRAVAPVARTTASAA